MTEKRDTIIENAFAETVGGPANPFAGPGAFASFGYQMMRSSIVFWSELTESMMRTNAAMLRKAVAPAGATSETHPAPDVAEPVAAALQPARQARPSKPARLRVVASAATSVAPPKAPDDLKAISGIGPKLEKVLNGMGISSFADLAALDAKTIAGIEDKLGFSGRIGRDDWVAQARALAAGAQKAGSKRA